MWKSYLVLIARGVLGIEGVVGIPPVADVEDHPLLVFDWSVEAGVPLQGYVDHRHLLLVREKAVDDDRSFRLIGLCKK